MRILVVEDDTILADGIRVGLGLSNGTVEVVVNCADCRCALTTTAFDVVVLDLMLPDGSGLDMLRELLASRRIGAVFMLRNRRDRFGARAEVAFPPSVRGSGGQMAAS